MLTRRWIPQLAALTLCLCAGIAGTTSPANAINEDSRLWPIPADGAEDKQDTDFHDATFDSSPLQRGAQPSIVVADNHSLRRITLEGEVTTLANMSGVRGVTTGEGRRASVARLFYPRSPIVDPVTGDVLFVNSSTGLIQCITPRDELITVAGIPLDPGHYDHKARPAGGQCFTGDGDNALNVTFAFPSSIAFGRDKTIFVADSQNYRIRAILPATQNGNRPVITIGGNGNYGSPLGHDGEDARAVSIGKAVNVAVSPAGTVVFADDFGIHELVPPHVDAAADAAAHYIIRTLVRTSEIEERFPWTRDIHSFTALAFDRNGDLYFGFGTSAHGKQTFGGHVFKRDALTRELTQLTGSHFDAPEANDELQPFAGHQIVNAPHGLTVTPDGSLLLTERKNLFLFGAPEQDREFVHRFNEIRDALNSVDEPRFTAAIEHPDGHELPDLRLRAETTHAALEPFLVRDVSNVVAEFEIDWTSGWRAKVARDFTFAVVLGPHLQERQETRDPELPLAASTD